MDREEIERYISADERDAIPLEDFAWPEERKYPVRNQDELDSTARLIGHAPDDKQAGIKARAMSIAKRKHLSLPESWQDDGKGSEERMAGEADGTFTGAETFSMYAPFTRISPDDDEKREVVGAATRGQPIDTYKTVIAYEASKKAFARAGHIAVREMHQTKAVGKGLQWYGDDKTEDIILHSYISRSADGENTWTKVKEQVLTGYSIRGANAKYGTIMRDGKPVKAIIDYDLVEVSLVDNPSCPGCDITILRGAGIEDVIASDAEMAEVLQKEQQPVTQNETPAQTQESFERAGATISSATQDALHSARNSALGGLLVLLNTCGCAQCAAASQALDPDGDGDIDWLGLNDTDGDSGAVESGISDEDMLERVERVMGGVYSRMQAYLGEFSRRQTDTATLQSAIERIAGNLEHVAVKTEVDTKIDKVLTELAEVKGLFERMSKQPLPGGPHTGRSAQKHLATDGPASPSAEETPDLLRQVNQAGVQLTAQQQALLIAGSLKRM